MSKETNPIELLNRAARLAPRPEREDASREEWARYWVATGLAADAAFRQVIEERFGATAEQRQRQPELGYLPLVATAAMSAAVPLLDPDRHVQLLWDLTPEAGALNGAWSEWLTERMDELGVNPADLDPALEAGDFVSPSRLVAAGCGGVPEAGPSA